MLDDVLAAKVDWGSLESTHKIGPRWLEQRTPTLMPTASQMRMRDATDAEVRSRSSWLMNPFVRPVELATCSIESPRNNRLLRSRAPIWTVCDIWVDAAPLRLTSV